MCKRFNHKIFNTANCLTYFRLAIVPVIVVDLFYCDTVTGRGVALLLYIVATLTDFFDGYIARTYDQTSSFGRMLDPIADKLLVAACLITLTEIGTIHGSNLWAAIVILCREIIVSGLREHLSELNVRLPVSRISKWKTCIQFLAIGFLIAGPFGKQYFVYTPSLGLILLWVSATITLYTGWDYFKNMVKHVIEQ